MGFLPVNFKECKERGWDAVDFVYITGDAYVDHPSFGVAIISRVLESEGFHVSFVCATGASVLNIAQNLREGVIVCASILTTLK